MRRLSCTLALIWLAEAQALGQVVVPLPGRPGKPAPTAPAPPAAPRAPDPVAPPPSNPTMPLLGQDSVSKLPIGKHGRPDINPYERDIDLTAPLTFRRKMLGDLSIRLTADDRLLVDREAFLSLIGPLLNPVARETVTAKLGAERMFAAEDIVPLGVNLEYDPSSLAVVVLTIDPRQRLPESLFQAPTDPNEKPDIAPADFSAFLNISAVENYFWGETARAPLFSFTGAMRYSNIVFEGDAQYGDDGFGSDRTLKFSRNFARLVYDQPEAYRRWSLGDLTPEVRGQQTFVQMGGIGVTRQRRRFDPFRPSILQGNRQLVLQRDSSVRIYRNGGLYRDIKLDAGAYDLSALPLLTGSNDVQIEVRDNSGAVQSIRYNSYLDPIDLVPGDYEYGAYLGPTSRTFGRNPKYSGPVAFSGFYRKAFVNAPALGVGLQLSQRVQNVTGQTQYYLRNGGRIAVDAGLSNARSSGLGYSIGASYDQLFDRGGLIDSFIVRADYISRRYSGLGTVDVDNSVLGSINLQYTRALTPKLAISATGSYVKSRVRDNDSYRIGASANYYLSTRWSVRGGVDYSKFGGILGSRGRGLGFNVALVFQPDYRQRAEARHDSSTETSSLSYQRASSNRIGTFGFGGIVTREPSVSSAQGFVDYIGNRFDATLSHATFGQNLGRIGQSNVTSLRVGTSLAFADGAFGIGRRITDSFAVLIPHENLGNRKVVAGQSLANNEYIGKSGPLGGAVNNYLSSYVTQSIQYDIENPPIGYDTGQGIVRVKPPYRSGYKIKVGTDAFVSAMGTLLGPDGKPIALAGGRVVPLGGKPDDGATFFTNRSGRFAVQNLRPDTRYRVELLSGGNFEIAVPAKTEGLVDMKTITLGQAK